MSVFTEKSTKWFFSAVASTAVGLFSANQNYGGGLPPLHALPIFLAPIVTMFVATMTFLDHCVDEEPRQSSKEPGAVIFLCIGGALVVATACYNLTVLHTWWTHLGLMLGLFFVFFLWDLGMLKLIRSDEHRQQIALANRLVNRPTIVAVILALIFLKVTPMDSLALVREKSGYASGQEAFAAGLISFHLIVSAVGYISSTLFAPSTKANRLGKFLSWLFNVVPAKPS